MDDLSFLFLFNYFIFIFFYFSLVTHYEYLKKKINIFTFIETLFPNFQEVYKILLLGVLEI